jgi:hypothetical protein
MGEVDIARQVPLTENAWCRSSSSKIRFKNTKVPKQAIRDWINNPVDTHYHWIMLDHIPILIWLLVSIGNIGNQMAVEEKKKRGQ